MVTTQKVSSIVKSVYAQQHFTANLSGSKGAPPINAPAMGVAKFTLSPDGKSISYILNVTNIHSVIGAHIHAGSAKQNGPIVIFLFGNAAMTGSPTGKVNGVFSKDNSTAADLRGTSNQQTTV